MSHRRTEVAHLHVGQEFIDRSDIPHVVIGFKFSHNSPAWVTVLTDMRPNGIDMQTTEMVWAAAAPHWLVRPGTDGCEDYA